MIETLLYSKALNISRVKSSLVKINVNKPGKRMQYKVLEYTSTLRWDRLYPPHLKIILVEFGMRDKMAHHSKLFIEMSIYYSVEI